MVEFPLVLDDDAAGANHILEDIQSSGGQREYQDDDLDAADMRAFSVENTGGVYNDNFPEQKDVSVTSLPSATRKRNYTLFADTITSKPASKDSRLVKRWRSAQPQVESLVPSPVCTPTSTPSADCGSQILSLRTSNDLDAGYLDNSSKGNGADVLDPVRGGLLDSVNSGDGEHDRHAIDEVLSESERMKGYQYVNPDLYGGEDKSHGTGSKVRDSDEDELNWANDVSSRAATATFQQHKCSSRPLHDSRRGPSRTSLKHLGGNMRPARIKSSPLRRYSGPKSDVATRSDTLQTSSSGTRAVHNHTINYGQGDPVDCCPTDITLSLVPKCTTLVTAIIRSNEMTSKLAPKPLTVVRDLLGDTGQLIRMTQVTSDLWLLVSCRFDHTLDLHTGRSSTQRSGDYAAWKTDPCSPHSKGANYDAVGPDEGEEDIDDGDDHLENGDESSGGSDSDAAAGWRPNRNRRRIQVRTRRPWPKSDDLRLLACKSKMGMKWEDIFPLFPSRTPGAVQARWYMLQRPEES
ncbi:hypothetical protein K469DRAFT_266507 [Zopfia rhizophila CBS 207.26]|uniref:Myb-like domain-containing protein n=1 Tax=Zopfia rhizophila CBS 207.26 TaxID=1314779 RepID=A0A6A6DRJ2_9PEZI|nr:hypothetical protein K469DRAFT_266507 [Zopfia rhizophila CBS 207.26]